MENLIGFFSSDARPLYKEDIYRTLALPDRSIIHFRYNQKYIQDDIVTNHLNYLNSEGVIFFVTGNDLRIPEQERKKESHSIRKIVIKNIYKSEETRHFHFSLELHSYYDCEIVKTEPHKFVSCISVNEGIGHYWIDRVKAVEDHFDDILFFKYDILKRNNKKLNPKYSQLSDDAIYRINDESEYKIVFSFYDKLEGASCLEIADTEHINIHYKECSNIGAVIDDRRFKLVTRTIQQNNKPDTLKICPKPNKSELKYEVISFFEIKKGRMNIMIFGLLSSSAFLSIILSQVAGTYVKMSMPLSQVILLLLVSVLCFGISATMLFSKFNKK
jgi:hypothetical protein